MTGRDLYGGLIAAAGGLLAMACTAAAGLLLVGAERIGELAELTAAVVALAVGGPVDVLARPATGLPVALQGGVQVMPLGVSLAGAVVLGGLLLRRGKDRLLVRGLASAVALPAGLAAVALLARGALKLQLPTGAWSARSGFGTASCTRDSSGQPPGCSGGMWQLAGGGPGVPLPSGGSALDASFSVVVGQTALGGAGFALAVAGVCWLLARFHLTARLRVVVGTAGAVTAVCLIAAWVSAGAAAAGGVLLALPLAVFGMLLLGLGVPWTFSSDGLISCAANPNVPIGLTGLSVAVLLACAIAVAARRTGPPGRPLRRAAILAAQFALVVGGVLTSMALLVRVSVQVGIEAFFFQRTVLEAQVATNPLIALALGLAAGGLAGFAGSLLVDGLRQGRASLSWRAWSERIR